MTALGNIIPQYTQDERGTAKCIADTYKDSLAWSEEMGKWLVRRKDESIWRIDTLVERTSKAMFCCERQANDHQKMGMLRLQHMRNALELAKPLLAVELSDFDLNPWALNTPDGLFSLYSCEYIPIEQVQGKYMRSTRVIPERVATPLWDSHLWTMCHGDIELIAYLKRLAGITLIGDQNLKPHVSPQLNGLGRNGKGVFLQALGWALGDYSQFASTRLLTTTENAHTTEQAGLRGMRLVVVEEVKRINSSILKDLTGGGTLRARRMRMDDEEFLKSWTLWFNNNGPMVFTSDVSDGLWQRIPTIDLGRGIPVEERVDDMAQQIKEEASGILQWMIDGWIEYRELGDLCTPDRVKKVSNQRRDDSDPLGIFLVERYEFNAGSKVVASDFMNEFNDWAKASGELHIGGRRAVYEELRSKFRLTVDQGAKGKYYIHGLKHLPMSFGEMSPWSSGLEWEDRKKNENN